MYHIKEQFIRSKYPDQSLCEDGIYTGEHFVAVIDGVTSKGKLLWDGVKSGRYAKEVLLKAMSELEPDIDAVSAVKKLNSALYEAEKQVLETMMTAEERPQAAIIIYSDYHKEVWSFGDCCCMLNGILHKHEKRIDALLGEVRSLYDRTEIEKGKTIDDIRKNDTGREYIMPMLKLQMVFANKEETFGYDILDGYDIHPERTVVYKAEPGEEVILASDGYPALKPTLAESEAELDRLLKEDSLCIYENIGTKGVMEGNLSFDDRSYIRFTVDK